MAYTLRKGMDEKRKRVIEDHAMDSDDEYEILSFQVQRGEGIDEPRSLHSMQTRYYRVYAWIRPCDEGQACSKWIKGSPNPLWNTLFRLPLDDFEPSEKYLHLEVVKYEKGSKDPEPSSGEVLVGRTQIRLPEHLTKVKSGSYHQLVKLHDDKTTKPAGYIIVSDMQLKKEYH